MKQLPKIKLSEALLDSQQERINILQGLVIERENLLLDILAELNHDLAHYGPAHLSEGLIQRIEQIVLEK